MIWMLFGLLLFALAYNERAQKDRAQQLLVWVCMMIGTGFFAFDIYTGLLLPSQIAMFYNDGAGITYGNSTRYDMNDLSVAFFMAQTKWEWYAMEIIFMACVALGAVFMLLLVANVMKGNLAGLAGGKR